MNIWLTADTHFGHDNIIRYCNRPFNFTHEMNEYLVHSWNSVVNPDDVVIHVGDVAMGSPNHTMHYLAALNGRKILCAGNHDSKKQIKVLKELHWVILNQIVVNDVLIRHYPMVDEHDFEYVIHGHSHGECLLEKHIDVGVDAETSINFAPIPAAMLLDRTSFFALHTLCMNIL